MSEPMLAASTVDPRIGQIVQDRYRIVRKIGEGGMGAVYEGEHTVIKRKVAIKCLHAQYATNQEMVNRFHREAMAANAIRHPNIVEVTDMGRFEDGAVFMVLEFLEGKELAAVLKQTGAMPLSRVVYIISQVCDALSSAHEAGIVHRDLKPDNIYLCPRGEDDPDFAKVLDFGIAKFRETGGQGMTRTGMTMGTPNYMAPEQAQASKDLDHRADIYSLGVIVFHLITGVLPYDDESFPMLMVKVVSYPAPRMSSVSPEIRRRSTSSSTACWRRTRRCAPRAARRSRRRSRSSATCTCATPRAARRSRRTSATRRPAPSPTPPPGGNLETRPMGGPMGSSPQVPVPGSNPMMQSGYGSQPQVQAGSYPSAPAVEAKSGAPIVLIAVAAIVLLLGGGGAFAFASGIFGGSDDGDATPPPVTTRAPDPPPTPTPDPTPDPTPVADTRPDPTPPPPQTPQPTAEQTVRVQISTTPADAELFLDGEPIANPLRRGPPADEHASPVGGAA
ncbi:MAG: protein kinase [Sandaracinaceae bacterium]|nr:protein kinase [Sandaracinaceae bacterium]